MKKHLFLLLILPSLACSLLTGGGGNADPANPPSATQEETVDQQPNIPAATPTPFDPLTGSGNSTRTVLTFDELMSGESSSPVDDAAFAIPADAAPPTFTFQGKLELTDEAQAGGFQSLRDDFGYSADPAWMHLPEMSFEFVQSGSHLIPVDQSLVYSNQPTWNYMVAPGRAWNETGDQGFSRASFPFALIERNQNCVHNGVMTFLFNDTTISNVRYQVTQETCMYFKFDMWGQLKAAYTPSQVANAEAVTAAHFDWLKNQLPTKPMSALASDYPNAKVNETFMSSGTTPEHTTVFGVFYNGVNYISNCNTRHGQYAYCSEMRLPSYSTAKSVLAGMAYMHLGQLYDENVGDILVKEYLPEATNWDSITLEHTLDMATGRYEAPTYMTDEDFSAISTNFLVAEKYDDKLKYALSFPASGKPGEQWVYQSTATFVATQTMYAYLRQQAGGDADLFDMLVQDIFIPLHLSTGTLSSLRTDNSPTGRAFGSHGMFYTQDDIAKIAAFLNSQSGQINGEQILHPDLLAATMQRDSSDHGLSTGSELYNNSFWAKEYRSPCQFYVPFMWGYGGISVAMLPNGATYYAFSDNGEFTFDGAVNELSKLSSVCP
ncbi:MAG TPA: serine hydrolase [Anaerolineales bacterium]|nr:serine hydrolase [Anaerolineales bacterium]